jgi:PAS domain S-box-containing protein
MRAVNTQTGGERSNTIHEHTALVQRRETQTEAEFRIMLETAPFAVSVADSAGLRYVNPAFTALFGFTVQEAADRFPVWRPARRKDHAPGAFSQAAAPTEASPCPCKVECKDGSHKTVLALAGAARDNEIIVLYLDA